MAEIQTIRRVTSVKPDDVSLTINTDGTFALEFKEYVWDEEKHANVHKIVRLGLADWWVGVLAGELRSVAAKRFEDAKALLKPFSDAA